ncbi:radical SAM protein [Alteromonas sp. ASW11-130]|uniref:radical SAM protein n=1 Tax=Alteromonas sp. ASW11-130 TaxID=3015775 RepID=UPI002241D99B|nr:radical SAM protein [Alteromonas sp. ASW11-130]MCW8091379.1 radical SAM protein [Alteromonas sp. ASW11-130]
MLKDNSGSEFQFLRLSITEACNFRCQYCLPNGYQGPAQSSFLTISEIDTLVSTFDQLGTSEIRTTGEKPSLYKGLADIIETCAQTPSIQKVALTTHGAILGRLAARWARAGCSQVKVSVDSRDPVQFSAIPGQDKLKVILSGIHQALAHGLSVKINEVTRAGYAKGRLKRFLSWIKDKPVSVKLIELMQTGEQRQRFFQQHQSGQSLLEELVADGWVEIIRDLDAGPTREFCNPDYVDNIEFILPYSKDFCQNRNRLRVSAPGNLHLCLFSEEGISNRGYLKTKKR